RAERWYYHERRALAAAGREQAAVPESFEEWAAGWFPDRSHIHRGDEVHSALAGRFGVLLFERTPYLSSFELDPALEPLERRLIEEGGLEATGCRFVGELPS